MNKLGFHVNRVSDEVWAAIMKVRPPMIKTIHLDVDFWRRVKEALPDLFLVGRLVESDQQYSPDPEARGKAFAEKVLAQEINRHRLVNAWESLNEVLSSGGDPAQYEAYDRFQSAFSDRLQMEGLEAVAMNFGTGHFLGEDWVEHFPRTLEAHRYLGFHEYDWPNLWRLHREAADSEDDGMWLALRYRRIMRAVREEYGDKHVAIITEAGLTQAVYPGRPDVGWRSELTEDQYWDSLKWYNEELAKDDYVLGAAIFVVGATSPWHSFETLGGVIDRMATLTPYLGQYRSHYVLLPQGTPWSWYDACRHYFLKFRPTRGESADDAAKVHGAAGHIITCINALPATIDYLKKVNPEAEIDQIEVESAADLFAVMKWRADNDRRYG